MTTQQLAEFFAKRSEEVKEAINKNPSPYSEIAHILHIEYRILSKQLKAIAKAEQESEEFQKIWDNKKG